MKKYLAMAVLGIAALSAFAATCTLKGASLTNTNSTNDTYAAELANETEADILAHQFVVAFLDGNNAVIETKIVDGCLRSLQGGASDFFSTTSSKPAADTNVALSRLALDSSLKYGQVANGDVTLSALNFVRVGTTLTVTGTLKNNDNEELVDPIVCAVVRDNDNDVIIVKRDTTINNLSEDETDTFTIEITVPNDSNIVDEVDLWVDGLDGSSSANPIAPASDKGNVVTAQTATPTFTPTVTGTPPTSTATNTPAPTATP